jgi:hypothetical protein
MARSSCGGLHIVGCALGSGHKFSGFLPLRSQGDRPKLLLSKLISFCATLVIQAQ